VHSSPLWEKGLPISKLSSVPGEANMYLSVAEARFYSLDRWEADAGSPFPNLRDIRDVILNKQGKCHIPIAHASEFKEGVHVCVGFFFWQ
jgi:hypothetical protein